MMKVSDSHLGRFGAIWVGLGLALSLYGVLRLPALLHQAGGHDEQFFAVPGWTVYREGVPRIPYIPSRNRASYFENADRCLMALPPGMFYAQAPFFALFPPGYPTARLPSFCGALVIIVLTFFLASQAGAGRIPALVAAFIVALSRPLMFTGLSARPDLLCVLSGLLALFVLIRSNNWDRPATLLVAGGLCGLAALFHPVALVVYLQIAFGLICHQGTVWLRFRRLAILSVSCGVVFSLWLPLVVLYPQEFFSQFFANVLERSGPGLFSRLLWPWDSLRHQVGNLWELAGAWQFMLLLLMLVLVSAVALGRSGARRWDLLGLVWSSVYLTATVAGVHPTLGYWLYPAVIIVVCASVALTRLSLSPLLNAGIVALVVIALLPGAGLRTSWLYLRHFGEPEYHARKFIAGVLSELPEEGLVLADLSYVFDVYLSGRETLLSAEQDLYWGKEIDRFRYMLVVWEGLDARAPEQYHAQPLRLQGDPTALGKCYVYLYTDSRQ